MRFKEMVSVSIASAFGASAAFAQGGAWLGGNGGLSVPHAEFANNVIHLGYNLGATGDVRTHRRWALGGEAGFHRFRGNLPPGVTGKLTGIPVLAHARFLVPSRGNMLPYIVGGVGVWYLRAKEERLPGTGPVGAEDSGSSFVSDDTDLAIKLGGGLNFRRAGSDVVYGIEGVYHYIATEGTRIRHSEPTKIITVRVNVWLVVGEAQ